MVVVGIALSCGQSHVEYSAKVMLNIVLTVLCSGCQMKNSILNGVVGQLNDNMQLFFHCGELRKTRIHLN